MQLELQTENSESVCSESDEQPSKGHSKPKKAKKPSTADPFTKKINLKRIILNISDTQYDVVREVAEELDWKIQTKSDKNNWDVWWTDGAIFPDVLFRMNFYQKINHYPGIHVIARKNLLGLNLMAMREKFTEEYDFFPMTWMLPSQYSEFRHYYESIRKGKVRTYIVKPEADCQGRGIFLTRNIEELINGHHYVVQRYVTKPFLIDGLKFDMRIYVLLAGTEPLRVYLYNQGLARFATQPYQQPTTENMDEMCMHLTNYAVNKHNPKFVFNTSAKDMSIGHKRSLSSVFKRLAEEGYNVGQIKRKIKDIIIKTFISGLPLVSHQYRYCQPEQYYGNMCFHILGFDVMLTNELRPILLQVNHTPSFTTDTPLDRFIKRNLIKDTLNLLNINLQTKQQLYNKTKQYNSLRLLTGKRRIFKGLDKNIEVEKAMKERDQYQKDHMGGFQRIHPTNDQELMEMYQRLLDHSETLFKEENTLRGRLIREERNKLARPNTGNLSTAVSTQTKQKQPQSPTKSVSLTVSMNVKSMNSCEQQRQPPPIRQPSALSYGSSILSKSQSIASRRPPSSGPLKLESTNQQRIVMKCESLLHRRLSSMNDKQCTFLNQQPKLQNKSVLFVNIDVPSIHQHMILPATVKLPSTPSRELKKATTSMSQKHSNSEAPSPTRKIGCFLKPKVYDINQQNIMSKEMRMMRLSGRCFPLKSRSKALPYS